MVKGVYTVDQSQPTANRSRHGESRIDVYDNPTFSTEDADRVPGEATITHTPVHLGVEQQAALAAERAEMSPAELTALDKAGTRFAELPVERGDRLKLAFLVGFPLTFFFVAIIVTSQYQ